MKMLLLSALLLSSLVSQANETAKQKEITSVGPVGLYCNLPLELIPGTKDCRPSASLYFNYEYRVPKVKTNLHHANFNVNDQGQIIAEISHGFIYSKDDILPIQKTKLNSKKMALEETYLDAKDTCLRLGGKFLKKGEGEVSSRSRLPYRMDRLYETTASVVCDLTNKSAEAIDVIDAKLPDANPEVQKELLKVRARLLNN